MTNAEIIAAVAKAAQKTAGFYCSQYTEHNRPALRFEPRIPDYLAEAVARAAIRALVACEPSEGMGIEGARSLRDSLRWDNQIQRANAAHRAMLAELAKE